MVKKKAPGVTGNKTAMGTHADMVDVSKSLNMNPFKGIHPDAKN